MLKIFVCEDNIEQKEKLKNIIENIILIIFDLYRKLRKLIGEIL